MTDKNCDRYTESFQRLVDGSLGAEDSALLADHVTSCPRCHAEYDWLIAAEQDLYAIGEKIACETAPIDIISAVLAKLDALDQKAMTPLRKTPRRSKRAPVGWLVAAAAAALVVFTVWIASRTDERSDSNIAKIPADTAGESPTVENVTPDDGKGPSRLERLEDRLLLIPVPRSSPDRPHIPPEEAGGELLNREGVWASYKDTLEFGDPAKSEEALRRLIGLATISLEQAKDLLNQEDISPAALAYAATEHPSPEATEALYQVVGNTPDDPHLRLQLARAYSNSAGGSELAVEQYDALSEIDPANALIYYLQAQQYLYGDPPDLEAAMQALEMAQSLDTAYSYSSESALGRAGALFGSGIDPEVAQLLSALTAGRWEYAELTSAASSLLAYGGQLREAGQYETAQAIYEAALRFGKQIDNGAFYAQESLAAVDIQREALYALQELHEETGNTSELEEIVIAAGELLDTTEALIDYFSQYNTNIHDSLPEDSFLGALAEVILGLGDLNILEFFADIANR